MKWIDFFEFAHTARMVHISLCDDDTLSSDDTLCSGFTDNEGKFSLECENKGGIGEGQYELYIKVSARGRGFKVTPPDSSEPYAFCGELKSIPTNYGADITVEVTINNRDALYREPQGEDISPNFVAYANAAFSIHQALVMATEGIEKLEGKEFANIWLERCNGLIPVLRVEYQDVTLRDKIPVIESSWYDFTRKVIHIEPSDAFDWDAIHHEFGHCVGYLFDVTSDVGGTHLGDENLSDGYYGETGKLVLYKDREAAIKAESKEKGIKLAWNEGFATYFGISLQKLCDASSMNIRGVGDSLYQDIIYNKNGYLKYDKNIYFQISYDLEISSNNSKYTSKGEDNEISVQRVLWDLVDERNVGRDRITLSIKEIWDKIKNAKAKTLSEAIYAITRDMTTEQKFKVGEILSEHKIAPMLSKPEDGAIVSVKTMPKFEWTCNGDCRFFKNNKFVVEFYDSNYNLIFKSKEITTNSMQTECSYQPTKDEWKTILRKAGKSREIRWVVRAWQTDQPSTGEYLSESRTLVKPSTKKLDVVFLIDTTGSMWDDIENVKASVTAIIENISQTAEDWRVAVADYKDYPYSPYGSVNDYPYRAVIGFTSNKEEIIKAVNSLYASGGADWQESVYTALMNAIEANNLGSWRADAERVIILMGDAPPHDPEPYTGYVLNHVIEAANNKIITAMSDRLSKLGVLFATLPVVTDINLPQSDSDSSKGIKIFTVAIGMDEQTKY